MVGADIPLSWLLFNNNHHANFKIMKQKIALLFLFLIILSDNVKGQGSRHSLETIEFGRLENFKHVPQTQTNWCWAATLAEVINTRKGTDLGDCEIVSEYFSNNCCSRLSRCNLQNSLLEFYKIVEPYGLTTEIYYRVDWETITNELRNSRPIIIRVESALGQGHFIVIAGFDHSVYRDKGNIRKSLILSDPMYGYFKGDSDLMGYGATWNDLIQGNLLDYKVNWTHTVLFPDL